QRIHLRAGGLTLTSPLRLPDEICGKKSANLLQAGREIGTLLERVISRRHRRWRWEAAGADRSAGVSRERSPSGGPSSIPAVVWLSGEERISHASSSLDLLLVRWSSGRSAVVRLRPLTAQGGFASAKGKPMPSPTTIDEFLELVSKSGVVEEKKLATYLARARAAQPLPPEPPKLAGLLGRDGLLTQFQAEQFLQGKWRRFTIGKYKVLEKLGAGGMGSVYLCEHKLMRRRVAVKVLPTAKAEDTSSLERFYREARAVAALDHPNIVRAYDIDQDDKLHFLVMEHVDGSSL